MIEYPSNAALVDYLFTLARDAAVFVEVGAYHAEASVRVAAECPDSVVLALEANPYTFAHLAPSMPERVTYLNVAASDTDGPIAFHIMSIVNGAHLAQIAGNNSLRQREQQRTEYESPIVDGRRIDSLLDEHGLVGLPCVMWVDVEGAQDIVLRGATRTLTDCIALMVEVEDTPVWSGQVLTDEVDALLVAAGMTCVARDREFPEQHNRVYVRAT